MGKLVLPPHLLEKLKCSICSEYLSIFPIFVKCEGEKVICGRCKALKDDTFLHDEAYENLARFIIFPCLMAKNGCPEELQPGKLKHHEQICIHRKFECPIKSHSLCQWQGSTSELLLHCEQNHTNYVLKERELEISFLDSFKENKLIPFNGELFIVKTELDSRSGIFWCSVEHLKQPKSNENYNYQLHVSSENKNLSFKFPPKSTDIDSDNLTTKVSSDLIKDKLNDPAVIIGKVELFIPGNESSIVLDEQPIEQKKNPSVDWDLLSELECPICFEYMLPPIYQCIQGHSICATCKEEVTECPLCREMICKTQNFMLERITHKLKYPCKYYKNGCSTACSSSEIRTHETDCLFGPYSCPLKEKENCIIKCNKSELLEHVDSHHDAYILKSDKINIIFNKNHSYEEYYLIKFDLRIFKGCFKYEHNRFFWAVQLVGTAEDCKPFKFEIDIVDNSGRKLRRYIKGTCAPLSSQDQVFANVNGYEYVSLDQVQQLINETFSYRIRVVKD